MQPNDEQQTIAWSDVDRYETLMNTDTQPCNVLLVEDENSHARLITEMLSDYAPGQFRVQRSADLQRALAALEQRQFDVILADLLLPDAWDLRAIEALHQATPSTVLIVLSSLVDERLAIGALRVGALDYLVKGRFEGDMLVRAIHCAVERKRGAEAMQQTVIELEQRLARHIDDVDQANTLLITQMRCREEAEQALLEYPDRLRLLYKLDRAILSAQSVENVLHAALCTLDQIVPYDTAAIAIFNQAGTETAMLAISNSTGTTLRQDVHLPLAALGDAETLREGRISNLPEVRTLPQPPEIVALIDRDTRSLLTIPLSMRGDLIGTLLLASRQPKNYERRKRETVMEVADQITIAIHNVRLQERVRVAQSQSRELSRRLMAVQESERLHLARELHDETGQLLTALQFKLKAMQATAPSAGQKRLLNESSTLVDQLMHQVRTLLLDLRPAMLQDLGLLSTLRWHMDCLRRDIGLQSQLNADEIDWRLPQEIEVALFRVAQEALNNVVRHAYASRVEVELRYTDDEIHLTISDNGTGFDIHEA